MAYDVPKPNGLKPSVSRQDNQHPVLEVHDYGAKPECRRGHLGDRSYSGDAKMPKAKITQTGPDTANIEPFVLRSTQTTRLVFKPELVNSRKDENKPVKGRLLWQRRKPSEQG